MKTLFSHVYSFEQQSRYNEYGISSFLFHLKKPYVCEPKTNVLESSAVFPLPGTCFDSQAESIADKTFIRQWSDLRKTK